MKKSLFFILTMIVVILLLILYDTRVTKPEAKVALPEEAQLNEVDVVALKIKYFFIGDEDAAHALSIYYYWNEGFIGDDLKFCYWLENALKNGYVPSKSDNQLFNQYCQK